MSQQQREEKEEGSGSVEFVAVVELDEPYTREKVKAALKKSRFGWNLIEPPKGNQSFYICSFGISTDWYTDVIRTTDRVESLLSLVFVQLS